VFVGAGEALPAARQQAADLDLGDWVSFPGWAQEELVFDYLSTADVGLEPNTEDYVSPVKVMEYLAAGLPVVAFSAEENIRLAGEAAWYAPKGNITVMARLIDELLDDEVSRGQMGRIGQNRVKEFIAWDHQAGPYVLARAELLGQPPRIAPGPAGGSTRKKQDREVISVTRTGLVDTDEAIA
jgi:glycosyltransferase involved in cell wall biosynthesis